MHASYTRCVHTCWQAVQEQYQLTAGVEQTITNDVLITVNFGDMKWVDGRLADDSCKLLSSSIASNLGGRCSYAPGTITSQGMAYR